MATTSEKSTLISAKELASKLDVTDALVKKLVKDFSLETEKVKNRTHLPEESVKTVKKIIELKEEGKKPKEIKAILMPESEEAEEKPKAKKAAKKTTKKTKKDEKSEEKADEKEDKKAAKSKKKSEKKESAKKTTKKSKNDKDEDSEQEVTVEVEIAVDEEDDEPDYKEYIRDEVASEHEHLELESTVLHEIEDELEDELEDDEDIDELEEVEEETPVDKTGFGRHRKIRRKKFNFRYVQRQIANDSKRIRYLKHRLRRTNISPLERVTLEENLDKRSRLLNGWLHILRWIKSN